MDANSGEKFLLSFVFDKHLICFLRWESELKSHLANMFCTKMRPATKDTKNPFRQKPGPKPKKIKEDKVPYKKEKTR